MRPVSRLRLVVVVAVVVAGALGSWVVAFAAMAFGVGVLAAVRLTSSSSRDLSGESVAFDRVRRAVVVTVVVVVAVVVLLAV